VTATSESCRLAGGRDQAVGEELNCNYEAVLLETGTPVADVPRAALDPYPLVAVAYSRLKPDVRQTAIGESR
jgi:hypothetical protein